MAFRWLADNGPHSYAHLVFSFIWNKYVHYTVVPTKSDSDVILCLPLLNNQTKHCNEFLTLALT